MPSSVEAVKNTASLLAHWGQRTSRVRGSVGSDRTSCEARPGDTEGQRSVKTGRVDSTVANCGHTRQLQLACTAPNSTLRQPLSCVTAPAQPAGGQQLGRHNTKHRHTAGITAHLQHHRLFSAGVVHLVAVHAPVGRVGILLVWAAARGRGREGAARAHRRSGGSRRRLWY